jgi:hypothetical protein
MSGPRKQDFPPGLAGGLEHDDEDHRLGETGQIGPESPGDLPRDHPEWRGEPSKGEDVDKEEK